MSERTNDPWEDLVLAILSVNSYPLEKTSFAVETLRREGLFSPQNLARWTPQEIGTRLRHGGYDRGGMTWLFADRLESLGKFAVSTGVEECLRILRSNPTNDVKKFLRPVKGIGPKVLANFSLLRNTSHRTD